MKIAAIDIGSNAARIQISWAKKNETEEIYFKKIEYIRYPLRLGKDVFYDGYISPKKTEKFIKLMKVFKLMIELHEIEHYVVYATSAMREAKNGTELIQKIISETGIRVEVIDGKKEAILIDNALSEYIDEKTYVHIDVGGGSTEINIHYNNVKTSSISFEIGTVRNLDSDDKLWDSIQDWLKKELPNTNQEIFSIGTGGNINKVSQLNIESLINENFLHISKLETTKNNLGKYDLKTRMEVYKLNPDRADVIIPAIDIYIKIMKMIGSKEIMIPRVGLKDGMLKALYSELLDKNLD